MRKSIGKKARMAVLLLAALLVAACGGGDKTADSTATVSPSIPAGKPITSTPPGDLPSGEGLNAEIGVYTQEYYDNVNVEVLMITYDGTQPELEEYNWKHPEIELINNSMKGTAWQIYQDYEAGSLEQTHTTGLDILSYPFDDGEFLQIVTTCVVYPETIPEEYSRMWSYCFSKTEGRIITLEEMMEDYDMTLDDFGKAFETHHEPENGETVVNLNVSGFLINRVPATPVTHFLLEVLVETESDPYMCFYMYTPENDELEELNHNLLFDPEVYDLLSMDPPLRYEQEEDSGDSNGTTPNYSGTSGHAGYRVSVDTSGMEAITANCEYIKDDLYISMHAYPSSGEAYDETSMTAKITELEQVSRVVTVAESAEHSALTSYPAWLLTYETGSNEDTRHCVDVYFQTDSAEYRVHTSVPVDMRTEYHDEVGRRLATITMIADGSSGGGTPDDQLPEDSPVSDLISGEDEAMDILASMLEMYEGMSIVHYDDIEVEGSPAWLFAVGTDTEEKFTAEWFYAITHDGRVYEYDVMTDSYNLI